MASALRVKKSEFNLSIRQDDMDRKANHDVLVVVPHLETLPMMQVKRRFESRLPSVLGADVTVELVDLFSLEYCVGPQRTAVWSRGVDIADFDLVVLLGDVVDRAVVAAHYLHAKRVPFMNPYMLGPGVGKLVDSMRLTAAGVPVPQTLCGPIGALWETVSRRQLFDFPMILKADVARKGNDNFLIHSPNEFEDLMESVDPRTTEMLAQEYVPNRGDYRIMVFGGCPAVAFRRRAAAGSHLNNLAKGAHASPVPTEELPPPLVRDAARAAEVTENEVAGVDVVVSDETGQHYILEVNRGPKVATGAVADAKLAAFGAAIRTRLEQ
jgi:glutathione synthase/RimK-type ligase-like ATP-grasp enzyme